MRQYKIAILLTPILLAACSSGGGIKERCVDARARLAQARIDVLGPAPSEQLAWDYAKHREALEGALGDEFVSLCVERGDELASCILGADEPKKVLACARARQEFNVMAEGRSRK